MIELSAHAEGTVVPVRAHAGARRCGVLGAQAGMLKLGVSQAPERGKANAALADALAAALGVKRSAVELLAGATSNHKRFLVRGLSLAETRHRLAAILASPSGA